MACGSRNIEAIQRRAEIDVGDQDTGGISAIWEVERLLRSGDARDLEAGIAEYFGNGGTYKLVVVHKEDAHGVAPAPQALPATLPIRPPVWRALLLRYRTLPAGHCQNTISAQANRSRWPKGCRLTVEESKLRFIACHDHGRRRPRDTLCSRPDGSQRCHRQSTDTSFRNAILAALSTEDIEAIRPHLHLVTLILNQVLHEPENPIMDVFFVEEGVVSLAASALDNGQVEVGLTGREGLVGAPVILNREPYSVNRAFTQVPGAAYRMSSAALRTATDRSVDLQDRLPAIYRLPIGSDCPGGSLQRATQFARATGTMAADGTRQDGQ